MINLKWKDFSDFCEAAFSKGSCVIFKLNISLYIKFSFGHVSKLLPGSLHFQNAQGGLTHDYLLRKNRSRDVTMWWNILRKEHPYFKFIIIFSRLVSSREMPKLYVSFLVLSVSKMTLKFNQSLYADQCNKGTFIKDVPCFLAIFDQHT